MYKPVSVCIPAHNEGKAIAQTIDSVLAQDFPGEMEILVCSNASTDQTGPIVIHYASRHPNIRLISTQEKGKPNAWNLLQRAATHNYRVFTDGDVVIDSSAIRILYDELRKTSKVAVTGTTVPDSTDCDFLTKCTLVPPGPIGCLHGRLYAFDNKKLEARMEAHGYSAMPKDIIADDYWITLVVGEGI